MDPQKQREIASKGGKAAHQKGTAHEFTTEEARVAGRKGGAASRARRASTQGPEQGEESRSDEGIDAARSEEAVAEGSNGEATDGQS
jgi:general stress protein YciG